MVRHNKSPIVEIYCSTANITIQFSSITYASIVIDVGSWEQGLLRIRRGLFIYLKLFFILFTLLFIVLHSAINNKNLIYGKLRGVTLHFGFSLGNIYWL